jgi:hypothetical protein
MFARNNIHYVRDNNECSYCYLFSLLSFSYRMQCYTFGVMVTPKGPFEFRYHLTTLAVFYHLYQRLQRSCLKQSKMSAP